MSRRARLIARLYRALLALYPSSFRADFGEEMQAVFAEVLAQGQHSPGEPLWRLFWREIRGWPGSVLQEHLNERRYKMLANGPYQPRPLAPFEWLAAMLIFLLPLLAIVAGLSTSLPQWTEILVLVLFWGAVLFAAGLALVKGVPRWSLPYLGLVLLVGLALIQTDRLWGWLYPIFLQLFGPRSLWSVPLRILYTAAFQVLFSLSLVVVALALVSLLRLLPPTRGVWQRIRVDWTQLSYLLYGSIVFSILLQFDEYKHGQVWQMAAWLSLGLGAWFYLRARTQKKRLLALLLGATGAMWTVALAKWMLIPVQKWPVGYPVSPSEVTRLVAPGSTLVAWLCILFMLLAPALLGLLPPAPEPALSSEGKPRTA